MTISDLDFLREIENYYSRKAKKHGASPRGVDWRDAAGQTVRFKQLCQLFGAKNNHFSVNDVGCGYGALFEYIDEKFPHSKYFGSDISSDMIDLAKEQFSDAHRATFTVDKTPQIIADYCVASGIFNVRLGTSSHDWLNYILDTLRILDRYSRNGFAFNCLTSYADLDKKQNRLYYADPCVLFDFCKKEFSKNVALLHDYGLYEFTIIVRKVL